MKYWGKDEEEAIIIFNKTDNIEDKHKIYVKTIEPAFVNLIENIYYTFNFNKTLYDLDTIKHEAITHLYEKLSKYDVTRNKKSYSYFGTIVKNWLIQQSNSYKKRVFIDEDENDLIISEMSCYKYDNDNNASNVSDLIENIVLEFKDRDYEEYGYNQDDKKVVYAILDIIKEYKMLEINNKKQLYVYIREVTNLPSRKITKSLNKIKINYADIKNRYID